MKIIALIFGAVLLRFLFVSPFMLLFWWIRRSAKKLRPHENGTSIEFSLAPRMHVLIEIVIVSLFAFTALTVFETVRTGEGQYAARAVLRTSFTSFSSSESAMCINLTIIREPHRILRIALGGGQLLPFQRDIAD